MDRRSFLQYSAAATTLPLAAACGVEKFPAAGAPQSNFGATTTALEATAGVDLTGKIAVVTGCNSGIGFETMRILALRGAYVLGTARTEAKAQEACKRVIGVTTPVALELSDFDSVVACAETIRSLRTPIDILVCNAGMRGGDSRGDRQTINGIEKHFYVNHLGHFLLVTRLIDRMYFSYQGRVVIVGSRAGYRSAPEQGIEFDNIDGARDYSVSKAYAHSKLANALFSLELAQRLRGSRITSNALHPGLINTEIDRAESSIAQKLFGIWTSVNGKSVEQGAATSCYVATSPRLDSTSGAFFEDCNAIEIAGYQPMFDLDMASRLWTLSESLLGAWYLPVKKPDPKELRNPDGKPFKVPKAPAGG